MKRKNPKRVYVLLLALAMACCFLLPAAASAAARKPSIKLNASKVSLFPAVKGRNTYTLKASVTGTSPGKVKYMSSNRSVARVSKNGVITAAGPGTAVITAYTLKAKAACTVQCYNVSLKLNSLSEVTLKEGKTHQISVTTAPKTTTVTYQSSNPDVASVTSSGKITAVKPGRAVITVGSNGLTRTVSVTVAGRNASVQTLAFDAGWEFAGNSAIHTGTVKLYRSGTSNGIVVAVNAGHGTQGGESVRTDRKSVV